MGIFRKLKNLAKKVKKVLPGLIAAAPEIVAAGKAVKRAVKKPKP